MTRPRRLVRRPGVLEVPTLTCPSCGSPWPAAGRPSSLAFGPHLMVHCCAACGRFWVILTRAQLEFNPHTIRLRLLGIYPAGAGTAEEIREALAQAPVSPEALGDFVAISAAPFGLNNPVRSS